MAPRELSDLFDIGADVLATEVTSNGTITVQTGDIVSKQVTDNGGEWWQTVGLASRPPKAKPGTSACQAVKINKGDHDVIIATRDLRSQAIYGNLKDGETALYAAGVDGNAQGRVLLKQDGSVSLVTTADNTNAGRNVYLRVSPDGGFEVSTPWGRMTLGPLGFHVLHSSGARIDLGALAGLPGPLSALGGYAKMEAPVVSLKGGAVSVGTDGGATNEAATTLLGAFISSLVAAIGTITTATPGAAAMAPITAQLPALITAIGQIGKTV